MWRFQDTVGNGEKLFSRIGEYMLLIVPALLKLMVRRSEVRNFGMNSDQIKEQLHLGKS